MVRGRAGSHAVYLEVGKKRTFAGAIEWPGWARSGRDEDAALEALFAYGPRYARVLRGTRLGFEAPGDISGLTIVERLRGTSTTDFGALDVQPSADREKVTAPDLSRYTTILRACWRSFDRAVDSATGKELAKGPRGGGRDMTKIIDHLLDSEEAYLKMIGGQVTRRDPADRRDQLRSGVLDALEVAAQKGVPQGPRGGKRWTPRFFARRSAWHTLDHAWEIEDRAL